MNFETAKIVRNALEAEYKAAGAVMKTFSSHANGLTPDAVKNTPEWKTARAEKDAAFAKLQKFNSVFVKTFAKELKEARK